MIPTLYHCGKKRVSSEIFGLYYRGQVKFCDCAIFSTDWSTLLQFTKISIQNLFEVLFIIILYHNGSICKSFSNDFILYIQKL